MKKISEFLSQNFQFLVVIFSIYLNMPVFVMDLGCQCSFIYSAISNDSFTEQTNKDPRYPHNVHLFRQFCV